MDNFRFSPNPNQAHQINWHPWGAAPFAKAQAEHKPVLLAISAVWCYWCHVMDETSYSDPDVRQVINEHYVAVRVDSDHRPDINARYNIGGWPTTAFLTGHGGLVTGATYLPPDQFLAMLMEVQRAYQEDRPDMYDHARDLLRLRKEQAAKVKAGPKITPALVDRVARSVAGAYDPVNGGFGEEPKFPNAPVLAFLTHLVRTTGEDFYRAMLTKTLDRMAQGGIFDSEEGGFFRHCAKADWSETQWEKLLEDNLNLAQVYADAWVLQDDDSYRRVAEGCLDYVQANLLDHGASNFRGSQGAHSEYFSLPLSSRRETCPPPADPSCYAASNAQAVSTLLTASCQLGRSNLKAAALEILQTLDNAAQAGTLSHVYTGDGPSDGPAFLGDWAQLLNALLAAHSYTASEHYLERAKSVTIQMVDRFFDEANGGFFDTEAEPEAIGYLQVREKPLAENLAAAMGLMKLNQATRNSDYRELAEATISGFAETYREHGEFAASYGLAVDLWLNPPVEITIEGPPEGADTLAMLKAAWRLSYPHLDIKPVLSANLEPPALAHICLDNVCLPPVTDPDELAGVFADMVSPKASPFENIFERFPGV